MAGEISKYQGGLIQLIYQQGGNLTAIDSDILSMECVVAGIILPLLSTIHPEKK